MIKESEILYECGPYWVTAAKFKRSSGYKVWKNGATHSTLAATCGYVGERGLAWCKQFIADRTNHP